MDIKISGITEDIIRKALQQARDGRIHILGKMREALSEPRKSLSRHAPRITSIKINPEKIKDVIGPGGKVIRGIIADTGVKMDVDDSGTVNIFSADAEAADRALQIVKDITREPEIGEVYTGTVKKIMDFGAFVEILPRVDGLVHISQLDRRRVENVRDVLKEGDTVKVKVIDIDRQGRIKLSRKALLD
jgi:polyribonucleotide nucleotidyltransferase